MKRIIIAEDERPVRELAFKILILAGYEVTTAESVDEGREIDATNPADLVLTDNKCRRENDGLNWVYDLEAQNRKVILMSGEPVVGLPVGVPLLKKPFSPEALRNLVHDLLEKPEANENA